MTTTRWFLLALGVGAAVLGLQALAVPAAATASLVAVGAGVAGRTAARRAASRSAALLDEREQHWQQRLHRRDEQLAHTAHELRTPLTALLTSLEMVRAGYATEPDDCDMFLAQAAAAGRHMAFLIHDVLDLAAIEAGRVSMHVHPQGVRELHDDLAQILGPAAQVRSIRLHLDEVPWDLLVHADRTRLLQVILNLMGNAVKFSAPGTTVHLQIAAGPAVVRFAVVDDGPGVPADLRPVLFERFRRGADQDATEGTGLGLHLCRELVERMQGRIGYEPRLPRGSCFWFELPRAQATASPATSAPPVPADVASAGAGSP